MKPSIYFTIIFFVSCFSQVELSQAVKVERRSKRSLWSSFKKLVKKEVNILSDLPSLIESVLQRNIEVNSYGCQCADYSCGCCAHLEIPRVGLNDTGCVNLTYLPKDYGISFTMTIDNLTIYNETISARSPPPICFGAPVLKEYADLCVHFYDLDASTTKLHGCVDLEARMHKIVVGRYKIGCFNIGKYTLGRWSEFHRRLIKKMQLNKKEYKVELISTNN